MKRALINSARISKAASLDAARRVARMALVLLIAAITFIAALALAGGNHAARSCLPDEPPPALCPPV